MSSFNTVTCYSQTKKEYCDFKWVVGDYSLIFKRKNEIESPILSVDSAVKKDQFQLKLIRNIPYENGYPAPVMSLNLYFIRMSNDTSMKYNISVIKDEKIVFTKIDYTTGNINIINKIPENDMKKFVSSTDTIIFHCEFTVSTGNVIDSVSNLIKMDQVVTPKLKFDSVFLDEKLSDLKLRTACGKEIPAHRVVLAVASPVFQAMFNHDMLENKSQSVDMIDISYDAAVEMLRYIYTGSIESREISLIIDLLVAADKYEVENLKIECEKILNSKISSKNSVEILNVADKCNIKSLKKKAVAFIKHHIIVSPDSDDIGNMILSMECLNSK